MIIQDRQADRSALGAGTSIEGALQRLALPKKQRVAAARAFDLAQYGWRKAKRPARLKWHTLLMIALAVLVFLGSNQTGAGTPTAVASAAAEAQTDPTTTDGLAPLADPAATVYIAATVATALNLPMADQVNQQAANVANNALLSTNDNQSLSRPPIVATAGGSLRTVRTYKVKKGDSLRSISQKFDVSSNTIEWANNLSDADKLLPNAILKIPPVNGVLYVVHSGDTIASIAGHFHSTEAQIINFNDLELSGIKAGEQIMIPGGIKPLPVASVPVGLNYSFLPAYAGNGYDFGFCTWYVKTRRSDIPSNWSDAYLWLSNAITSGYQWSPSIPKVGAIAWESAGDHVAYVEAVYKNGTVKISEMNYVGWDIKSFRTVPSTYFDYIYWK